MYNSSLEYYRHRLMEYLHFNFYIKVQYFLWQLYQFMNKFLISIDIFIELFRYSQDNYFLLITYKLIHNLISHTINHNKLMDMVMELMNYLMILSKNIKDYRAFFNNNHWLLNLISHRIFLSRLLQNCQVIKTYQFCR